MDTDHKQPQRESTTSFQGHLSFPGTLPKEKNGGYLKAKDLTVQARASFNLIVMAHWLTHHHRAYVHKHIHRFPGNIPGSLDFSRTENTLLRYPLQLSKVAGCLFYAVLYSLPSNPDIIDWGTSLRPPSLPGIKENTSKLKTAVIPKTINQSVPKTKVQISLDKYQVSILNIT